MTNGYGKAFPKQRVEPHGLGLRHRLEQGVSDESKHVAILQVINLSNDGHRLLLTILEPPTETLSAGGTRIKSIRSR